MEDHTFKVIELAGASGRSVDDAIRQAVERAGRTLHGLSWFEVVQIRGRVGKDGALQYQVMLKVGFELDAA
jgi:flavin-binding protein dodecin